MGSDVVDRLLHAGDLLGFVIRNLALEFFFERHHQFHRIERICTQIINERGPRSDFRLVNTELLRDDFLLTRCSMFSI